MALGKIRGKYKKQGGGESKGNSKGGKEMEERSVIEKRQVKGIPMSKK